MANPAFRLTVINRGTSPRHYDFAAHEQRLFQEKVAGCAVALAQPHTPILAFSAHAYGKADDEDDTAAGVCPDCGTPEALVDAINASLLRKL